VLSNNIEIIYRKLKIQHFYKSFLRFKTFYFWIFENKFDLFKKIKSLNANIPR